MQISLANSLEEGVKHIKNSQRLLDFTLRLMDDKRILANCLAELRKATTHIIDIVLFLDNSNKSLGKEERARYFFKKSSKKYLSDSEILELKKILFFAKKHKECKVEFVRKNKLVIFGDKACLVLTEEGLRKSITLLLNIFFNLNKNTRYKYALLL